MEVKFLITVVRGRIGRVSMSVVPVQNGDSNVVIEDHPLQRKTVTIMIKIPFPAKSTDLTPVIRSVFNSFSTSLNRPSWSGKKIF